MIIHPVKMESSSTGSRLSARVEYAGSPPSGTVLWFEFPGSPPERFSGSPDGFLLALLLLAMASSEDIEVCGPLDQQLLSNLAEYQRIFHAWFPERFHLVEIRSRGLRGAAPRGRPTAVGSAFSGGVDSTYTLWSHLPANEPDPKRRITHTLFIHGFDIPLADAATFDTASKRYADELGALGIELVVARTNIREFVDVLPWELMHGSSLGAVVLMLDQLLGLFYLPASGSYSELDPWGSHPVSDPLMSTGTLAFVHHGCMARCDKIISVSKWVPARSWLRVCWERPDARVNCCRCFKCIKTMVSLELAGVLHECPTFPGTLERSRVRGLRLPPYEWREMEATLQRAVEAGRKDIVYDLRRALWASRLRHQISRARGSLKRLTRRSAATFGVGVDNRLPRR
jgi:hypothetical protein